MVSSAPTSTVRHAMETLLHLGNLAPQSKLRVSPLCYEHIDDDSFDGGGEVRGWMLDTPGVAPAYALPVGHSMFDGISIARCEMSESEVLKVMRDGAGLRDQLSKVVERIIARTVDEAGRRATWARCQPVSGGHLPILNDAVRHKDGEVTFMPARDSTPVVDSDTWVSELSPNGFVGVFHYWHHGVHDHRLCMFIACQSYLPAACMEFADMVRDVGNSCDAMTVQNSEEAFWLRKACARNRARIIHEVASELSLPVQVVNDINACVPTSMAACVVETLHYDMCQAQNGSMVRILNYVGETSTAANGIICTMAPWHGISIFHGCNPSERIADFGSPHGKAYLPTTMPRLSSKDLNMHGRNKKMMMDAFSFTSVKMTSCPVMCVWSNPMAPPHPSVAPTAAACDTLSTQDCVTDEYNDMDPDLLDVYQSSLLRMKQRQIESTSDDPERSEQSHVCGYLVMNEAVLQKICERGWNRKNGYTTLVPFALAVPACRNSVV